MTRSYAFSQKDSNHGELTQAYEQQGCSVADTSAMGEGFPDAVVGAAGVTDLVEFKTPDGELKPSQETFMRTWRGSIVWVVRTVQDVDYHVASMRKRARLLGGR